MKLIKKFLVDLIFTNEISNKDMSKSHQVIGSKVVKNLKLELIFSLIEINEIKFEWYKIGENLAFSLRLRLITQSAMETSDT